MKILWVIFGGVAVILLAIAGFFYFKEQVFLSTSEEATGKVTASEVQTDQDGDSYCPIIEFSTRNGQLVRFTGDSCSYPADFKIGDIEKVIYDPQNPKNVQVESLFSEYLTSFILIAIGVPFLGVALGGLITGRRKG